MCMQRVSRINAHTVHRPPERPYSQYFGLQSLLLDHTGQDTLKTLLADLFFVFSHEDKPEAECISALLTKHPARTLKTTDC